MDNLVFSCTDGLDQPTTPVCTTDYGETVVAFAVMKEGGTFVVAGSDNPTAAEFQTGITAGEVSYFKGISNGHKIEQGATELSGDDTITGGTERYNVQYRVEGRIKLIDESIKRATEKFDRFSTLRVWYFTEKNYVYGGKEGIEATPNFNEVIHEGRGNPPYLPFFFDYTAIGADYATYDADFDTLANP
jgi:hypothetical protein